MSMSMSMYVNITLVFIYLWVNYTYTYSFSLCCCPLDNLWLCQKCIHGLFCLVDSVYDFAGLAYRVAELYVQCSVSIHELVVPEVFTMTWLCIYLGPMSNKHITVYLCKEGKSVSVFSADLVLWWILLGAFSNQIFDWIVRFCSINDMLSSELSLIGHTCTHTHTHTHTQKPSKPPPFR